MEIYEWIFRILVGNGIKYIVLGHCFLGFEFNKRKTRYLIILYPLLIPLAEYLDRVNIFSSIWGLFVILFLFQGKLVEKVKAFSIMWFLVALVDIILMVPFLTIVIIAEHDIDIKIFIGYIGCLFWSLLGWKGKKVTDYTKKFWNNLSLREYVALLLMLILISSLMGGVQGYFYDAVSTSKKTFVLMLGIVLATTLFFISILLFHTRRSKERLEEIHRLSSRNFELQRKYFEDSLKRYEDMRSFRHDINKHLVVLSELSEKDMISELKEYLSEITDRYTKIKGIHTGNFIADCIVSHSLNDLLQREDFEFYLDGHFPEKFFMEDIDFCILLSNLLDNAREALIKVSDKKLLQIEVKRYQQRFYLNIRNSIEMDEVNFEHTSKTEGHHGYGIQNVKHVVEKYHGTIEWKVVSGMVEVSMRFDL